MRARRRVVTGALQGFAGFRQAMVLSIPPTWNRLSVPECVCRGAACCHRASHVRGGAPVVLRRPKLTKSICFSCSWLDQQLNHGTLQSLQDSRLEDEFP